MSMGLRFCLRVLAVAFVILTCNALLASAASCESLASLAVPDTTVTLAKSVAQGALNLAPNPAAGAGGNAQTGERFASLPAFCRVAATIKPTSDSDIRIEVWMPSQGWNGKFLAVGNGGWAGLISYDALAETLSRGYATASTDTGHVGNNGAFALGHPEKLIDFGHRAVHETAVKAKAFIAAFYGSGPRLSYWNGCSTGGRQGLKEAQFYPGDFDGIIAGASANPRPRLAAWSLMVGQAAHTTPDSYIPPTKYKAVHEAVVNACDAIDGLKDGLIDDPRRCTFNPAGLACKGEDDMGCLTPLQVEAMKGMLRPAVDPSTNTEIFPPLELGAELGWSVLAGPQPFSAAVDHFKYVVFEDPNWDWRTFNLGPDAARADRVDKNIISAIDPNLKPFFDRGGKLLMYHGWADQNVAARASINYYASVVNTLGADRTSESIRLFMAPGMAHCRGGDGPNSFDAVTALEQWVEHGKAPSLIIASHSTNGKVDRTRPLCAYPQVARYNGKGSIDDAANFECRQP
jgi:feruloyl esterase